MRALGRISIFLGIVVSISSTQSEHLTLLVEHGQELTIRFLLVHLPREFAHPLLALHGQMDKLQRILLTGIVPLINDRLPILVEIDITDAHGERDTIPFDTAETIFDYTTDVVDKLARDLLLVGRQLKDDNHAAQDVQDLFGFVGQKVALPFFWVLDEVEPDGDLDVVVGVCDGEGVGCAGEGVGTGWFDGVVAR